MSIQYDTIMYRTAGWNLSQSNKMKSSVIDFTSFWGRKFPLKVTVALHRLWSMRQWDHHMLSSAMRTCFMSWSHAPMRYALIYSSHLVILVHACHEVFKCVFFGQCTCNILQPPNHNQINQGWPVSTVQVARRCAWHRSVPPLGSWGSADASHLELLEPQHRSHPEIPIGNPQEPA